MSGYSLWEEVRSFIGKTIELYFTVGRDKYVLAHLSGVRRVRANELDVRTVLVNYIDTLPECVFQRHPVIIKWVNTSMNERGCGITRLGQTITRKEYIHHLLLDSEPLNVADAALCSVFLEGCFMVTSQGETYQVPPFF